MANKTYQLSIEGMTCAACAARIERVLQKDASNHAVSVNFATHTATLGTTHTLDEIKSAIEAIGYGVAGTVGGSDATVPQLDTETLEQRESAQLAAAKRRVVLAVALSVPVVVIGMLGLSFPGSTLIQLALTTLVIAGPGRGFFVRAAKLARQREASMDTLVALGTFAAYAYSLYLMAEGHSHLYFESATVIVTLILLGKFLEERARQSISAAIRALAKLQPKEALVLQESAIGARHDEPQRTPISALRRGALVLVRAGDRIPVDGKVRAGSSAVDESMLTGESLPIEVEPGATLSAGTLNLTGPLEMLVEGVGADTELARIIKQVETAQGTKAPIQDLADRIAGRFVPAALAIAAVTFVLWLVLGYRLESALTAAVAVLVVACPCALGLATPLALMVATGRAAQRGILVKDASSLQTLHKATALVFDKTGTLTTGNLKVARFASSGDRNALLALVRKMEELSSHPIAAALVRYARDHAGDLTAPALHDLREVAGHGLTAKLPDGRDVFIGRAPESDATASASVVLHIDGHLVASFALEDELRPDAKASIATLQRRGFELIVASGDQEEAVRRIADELAIDWRARMTPEAKLALITDLQKKGRIVAMVGDGINDAPALAAADIGIAMGTGTDAALQTAGITLREASIGQIAEAIALSRKTFANIKQNLFWAFAYNVLLIPLAAFGQLSPMLAAAAMALSSLFVVGNASRLSRIRLD